MKWLNYWQQIAMYQEIRTAPCFTIIIYSTQYITKVDQVSEIIRYTSHNYILQKINIKESFLGFFALHKHLGEDHVNLILTTLVKLYIDINKYPGQSGASVMTDIHSGGKNNFGYYSKRNI